MILYHGSLSEFDRIKVNKSKGTKDFGKGFYTTDSLQHAKERATELYFKELRLTGYNNRRYIYSYKVNIVEMRRELNVKTFNKMTAEWLDIIVAYRSGSNPLSNIDVIIGPTADARLSYKLHQECYDKVDKYTSKLNMTDAKKLEIMKELNLDRYGIQYCFRSNKAVNWLDTHLCERRIIND